MQTTGGMDNKKRVSVKSTKQEIWDAYQEIVDKLQSEPPSSSITKKLAATTHNLKSQLLQQVDQLQQTLTQTISDTITELEKGNTILQDLTQAQIDQTKILEREKQIVLTQRKREQEEYDYEFERRKRRQDEELKETKAKAEQEIQKRWQELKQTEDELKDLRQQVATFDQRLEKAVKEAVETNTKTLTQQFNHERAFAKQEAQNQKALLEQKVASLQETLKLQQQEVDRLKQQLSETSTHLTRIAERAVEKTPSPVTPSIK